MIPTHLDHLAVHEDLPVTWTARWSSETPTVRAEPLLVDLLGVAPLATFSMGGPGLGDPYPQQAEPSRARRSVVLGLCQVCGRPVGDDARNLLDLRINHDTFRYDGKHLPLIVDSWTCDPCLPYALVNCPDLLRRPSVDVLKVHRWLLVPTLEQPKWLRSRHVPHGPVGLVKIAVVEAEAA